MRFLVFFGETYYPSGGWHDFAGEAHTLEEAQEIAASKTRGYLGWWHIVDYEGGEIVASGEPA